MPNQYQDNYHRNPHNRHNHQYNRSSSFRNHSLSDADTSVDYHRDRDPRHYGPRRQQNRHGHQSHGRNYNHKSNDHSRDSYGKFHSMNRSFNQYHNSNHSFYDSREANHRENGRISQSFRQQERQTVEPKDSKEMTQFQIQREVFKIMEDIQKLDYHSLEYDELKLKFTQICGKHLKFETDFLDSADSIGKLLLEDGLFHEMWSLIIFKNPEIQKQFYLQSHYTNFKEKIKKNLSNFEKTYNPIPDEESAVDSNNSVESFKRDRKAFEENTRTSTRTNVIILYEQVKAEMKHVEVEQKMLKQLQDSVSEFKIKMEENFPPIDDPYNIEWFDSAKAMEKINAQEDFELRQAQIEKIKKQKLRQKSPLSNRFRMMHEVQSNQRRMAVEMASVFLNISVCYNFSEVHIVKVDQVIISENQEIIVLKAYSLDFCPLTNKMKLEPKVKNLIAVYKFCNLTELTRLIQTHGKFDGLIVYPECFNVQKYLATSEELSLLKSECIEQIKEQIKEEIEDQRCESNQLY